MKKFASLLLALLMIFALSANAFADEAETFTLTMENIKDHTYNVFQIYTGDISKEGETLVLSNIKYGKNNVTYGGNVGDLVSDSALQNFLNAPDHSEYFRGRITGDPYYVINPDGTKNSETFTVDAGYYLIIDETDESMLPDGQTLSPQLLKVAENTTIYSKHASIISQKKVDDKNDSTHDEDGVNWNDSADYDFGDKVPFQLYVELPSTFNHYKTYKLDFHDMQDAGFGEPTDFEVYIQRGDSKLDGVTVACTVNECESENCEFGEECDFTVTIADLKAAYTAEIPFQVGDKLVVEYKSELLDTAVFGRVGNLNQMFVCHPDGHTPVDGVTVLTYGLTVNKIDGTEKEALLGAGFTLYKWNADNEAWEKIGEEIKGENLSTFTWTGIDGGKYKLSETTTPAGYNTIADIEFVIDANHKTEWLLGGNYAFEDVIAKDPTGTTIIFADRDADGIQDGRLAGNIENYKGTVLPETGAEGTFFLVAMGTMLVMIASVFMITRKKMSIYED